MKRRTLLALPSLAAASWLTACGGGGGGSGSSSVRLLNASADYNSLDLYVNNSIVNTGATFGAVTPYADAAAGVVVVALATTGSPTYLLSQSRSLTKGVPFTAVAYSADGVPRIQTLTDNAAVLSNAQAQLNVLNTAVAAGALDVYLTPDSASLAASSPVSSGVQGGGQSGLFALSAGTYRLRVTGQGDPTDLRLDVSGVVIEASSIKSLVLTPGSGGVLVSALLVVQGGAVTSLPNTQARIRAVSAVTTGTPVSVGIGATSLLSNAISPTIGEYTLVNAGAISVSGTAGSVAVPATNLTLAAGSDVTLIIGGTAAAPTVSAIIDDNRIPADPTKLRMRLYNGTSGMESYPLTLTVDFSAVATNVATDTASAYATLAATTGSTLSVTSSQSATPLFTQTSLPLLAQKVYSVFMFGNTAAPLGVLRRER